MKKESIIALLSRLLKSREQLKIVCKINEDNIIHLMISFEIIPNSPIVYNFTFVCGGNYLYNVTKDNQEEEMLVSCGFNGFDINFINDVMKIVKNA